MGRTLSFIVMAEGIQSKARAARSCEYSATNAWNLNLNNGNANNNTKATNKNRVRPVSALLQITVTTQSKKYDYDRGTFRSVLTSRVNLFALSLHVQGTGKYSPLLSRIELYTTG